MTVMLGLLLRVLVFYFIIRFLFSLFSKKGIGTNRDRSIKKEPVKRYKSQGDSIEEADFEEVK